MLRLELHDVIASNRTRFLRLTAALVLASPTALFAQKSGLDFHYGLWWTDSVAIGLSAGYFRQLLGPLDYGVGLTHYQEKNGLETHRITGVELSTGLWRDGAGLYLVSSVGLGMRHSDGNFDTQWSAGGGYALPVLSWMSLGVEARYKVEDHRSRGFWRLDPNDRRGFVLQARVSFGSTGRRQAVQGAARPIERPSTDTPPRIAAVLEAGREGDDEIVALRLAVVETALDVMGTPYRWGGEGEGGFDCSGLIMYAYREHGLILPRTSRDQARTGQPVDRSISSLLPGDILGFSDGGGGITHVGLYVGDGRFIHSSSSGVKLSSLENPEGDGRWWQRRWVSVRRVIN